MIQDTISYKKVNNSLHNNISYRKVHDTIVGTIP